MSASYLQKIIETISQPFDTQSVYKSTPASGIDTLVTGDSGVNTIVFNLNARLDAPGQDRLFELRAGSEAFMVKPVPKSTIVDFELNLGAAPWKLPAGASLNVFKSGAFDNAHLTVLFAKSPEA
jgi:hypothetical protein